MRGRETSGRCCFARHGAGYGVGDVAGRISAWEEAQEFRALDHERVLVLTHGSGRGKTSRVDLEQLAHRGAVLFDVREGKVSKLVSYRDRDVRLADLGLQE